MKLSAIQKFTLLDYPGKVACIAFTPGCDLRCRFCHNPEFVLPERLCALAASFISEEHFFRFLAERRGLLEGVVVTGGEPTVWKDLPEFLAQIKALGFATKLDTNGNNPVALARVIDRGLVDYIAMDVKTSLADYPALVGSNVRPEHIRESIALIRASGVEYEFRTTLIREHHTEAVLEAMRELLSGATQIYFQTFRPEHTLDPAYAGFHGFSLTEMEVIAERFGSPGQPAGIRV
ncbi:MAG: anaerobic ribonucleoside-triphosphate reductase activating protein [Candidatus Moraniibacteriota bacterium]